MAGQYIKHGGSVKHAKRDRKVTVIPGNNPGQKRSFMPNNQPVHAEKARKGKKMKYTNSTKGLKEVFDIESVERTIDSKQDKFPSEKTSKHGSGADPSFMSQTRFDSFPLSEYSLTALHDDFGYQICTNVQAETMGAILQRKDVLAKAKTGTGKTIAFLLPSIESLLRAEENEDSSPSSTSSVRSLVICPTRELACQVAEEAKTLLKRQPGTGAQLVIGGTKMEKEARRLGNAPCQILIGTPGRLLDHIRSTKGVSEKLLGLQTLILDECDQLLDLGFKKTLDEILGFLPASRQTLLFSATLSSEVRAVTNQALRKGHVFVDTVGEETSTNVQVQQEYAIAPLENQLPAVHLLLAEHMKEEPSYKILVFSTTARQTQLLSAIFQTLGVPTLEIHSRKSQSVRTKVSDQFRRSDGRIVMFTSDVSARGVDYPDVTLVLQVGIPADKAQYIHRLGRTGRAGKQGKGVLLLTPWEKVFLKQLNDLPLRLSTLPSANQKLEGELTRALTKLPYDVKEMAYQSWLGFYNGMKILRWDKATLVENANLYSKTLGLSEPPAILRKVVAKMRLNGVHGLRTK